MPTGPNREPLTLRYAVILLLTLATTGVGSSLIYLAFHSIWLAIFTGGAAFPAAWRFYNEIISG